MIIGSYYSGVCVVTKKSIIGSDPSLTKKSIIGSDPSLTKKSIIGSDPSLYSILTFEYREGS